MSIAFVWSTFIITLMQCCTCKSRGKNNIDTEGLNAGEEDSDEDFKLHKEEKAIHFRKDETIDHADIESPHEKMKLKGDESERQDYSIQEV